MCASSRPPAPASSSVEKLPGPGAVEPAHANRSYRLGIEVPQVDAHAAPGTIHRFPVDDATTGGASHESEMFASPCVAGSRASSRGDLDLSAVVVRPKRAVAAADRTIAVRESPRFAREHYLDGATMAATGKHGVIPQPTRCRRPASAFFRSRETGNARRRRAPRSLPVRHINATRLAVAVALSPSKAMVHSGFCTDTM